MIKPIILLCCFVSVLATSGVYGQDVDSDIDAMPDSWEIANILNPNDPADANVDTDGDGFTNFEEYWMGTNPRDAAEPVTIYVDATYTGNEQLGTATQPYKRIQSAINAASSSDATAIMVLPGTYNERPFANGKAHIHFFSQAGAEATIIDGQQVNSSVVRIYNFNRATFRGFTVRNAATDWLGAGLRIEATNGVIFVADNIITSNKTTNTSGSGGGGGVYIKTADGSRMVNNFIVKNSARRGGGVLFAGGKVQFWHNTVADNEATDGFGGGISTLLGVRPDIRNNILWGNTGGEGIAQVHAAGSLAITNNIVQGSWSGLNNLDADPQFSSPFLNDYHVRAESPARNAAMNLPLVWDYDGEFRPTGAAKDIGADEFLDSDEDGLPDSWELRYGLNPNDGLDADYDYDGDGVSNYQEYVNGTDPTNWDTKGDGTGDMNILSLRVATTGNPCPGTEFFSVNTDPHEVTIMRLTEGGPKDDPFTVTGPGVAFIQKIGRAQIFRIAPQPGPITIRVDWNCDPSEDYPGPELRQPRYGPLNLGCHSGQLAPPDKEESPGCAVLLTSQPTQPLVRIEFSPGLPKDYNQSVTVRWSPVAKLEMRKANFHIFPSGHTFTSVNSPTVLYMRALEPGEVVITAESYGVIETNKLTIHQLQVLDAQGFDPQWTPGNPPTLAEPLYANIDTNLYRRIGAFSDGASLLVVRSQSTNQILGTVKLEIIDLGGGGTIQVESVALGTSTNVVGNALPPLPAPLSNPGTRTLSINDGSLSLFYRPPRAWRFPNHEKQRPLELLVTHGSLTNRIPFQLHKTPLVLVHGGWSSPTTWNAIRPALNQQVYTAAPNYFSDHVAGVEIVTPIVVSEIHDYIDLWRNGLIAATQVDYLAHSYGGFIARWWMQQPGMLHRPALIQGFTTNPNIGLLPATQRYRRANNFGVGDVRQYMTIGTPHLGSPWFDRLIRAINTIKGQEIVKIVYPPGIVRPNVDCLIDLRDGSEVVNALAGSASVEVPTRYMAGSAWTPPEPVDLGHALLAMLVGAPFLPTGQSDRLVPVSSQRNSSQHLVDFWTITVGSHMTETSSPFLLSRVTNLVHSVNFTEFAPNTDGP